MKESKKAPEVQRSGRAPYRAPSVKVKQLAEIVRGGGSWIQDGDEAFIPFQG